MFQASGPKQLASHAKNLVSSHWNDKSQEDPHPHPHTQLFARFERHDYCLWCVALPPPYARHAFLRRLYLPLQGQEEYYCVLLPTLGMFQAHMSTRGSGCFV